MNSTRNASGMQFGGPVPKVVNLERASSRSWPSLHEGGARCGAEFHVGRRRKRRAVFSPSPMPRRRAKTQSDECVKAPPKVVNFGRHLRRVGHLRTKPPSRDGILHCPLAQSATFFRLRCWRFLTAARERRKRRQRWPTSSGNLGKVGHLRTKTPARNAKMAAALEWRKPRQRRPTSAGILAVLATLIPRVVQQTPKAPNFDRESSRSRPPWRQDAAPLWGGVSRWPLDRGPDSPLYASAVFGPRRGPKTAEAGLSGRRVLETSVRNRGASPRHGARFGAEGEIGHARMNHHREAGTMKAPNFEEKSWESWSPSHRETPIGISALSETSTSCLSITCNDAFYLNSAPPGGYTERVDASIRKCPPFMPWQHLAKASR